MLYKNIARSKVTDKNISAFYGVNRTANINDFQAADMKNMDCESFPYAVTRKSRDIVYDENEMALICEDTDVYDDYKVTGITKDGAFVYRGEIVEPTRAESSDDESGSLKPDYSGATSMVEYLGDYVLLPSMRAITAETGGAAVSANETDFLKLGNVFESMFFGWTSGTYATYNISIGTTGISCTLRGLASGSNTISPGPILEFVQAFLDGTLYVGQHISVRCMCRQGTSEDEFKEIACPIPEDVYMVIEKMWIEDSDNTEIAYTPGMFERDSVYSFHLDYTVRRRGTGEVYNITPHLYEAWLPYQEPTASNNGTFRAGYVSYTGASSSASEKWCWNDIKITALNPPMLLGAPYGGRLFACDNLGVTVYYSAAAGERYDFTISGDSGGAGYVSCADPGKWTAMCSYSDSLYVFKRNSMYRIYSSDGLAFYMDRVADVGAIEKESVCVVDNVMYFLSDEGIYRFSGAYPQLISDALGRKYTGGALGGNGGKLFASLSYKGGEAEKHELCVWHIDKGIFSVHDEFCASQILYALGDVYALSFDGTVYALDGKREPVEFSIDTKKYFFTFQKKAVNAARLYFEFSGNVEEYFEVLVSCDGGEFQACTPKITNGRIKYIPIKLKKCDELQLRIRGYGVFTLKGLSFSLYQGGDVKQN